MVYTGTVVTDVKVGAKFFHNALVSIKFKGDTGDITPVPVASARCGDGSFFYLTAGTAVVSVASQGTTLTAKLNPGQIFVSVDACNGGIGFGAFTGPLGLEPAYPLAFTMGTAMVVAADSDFTDSGLTTPASMSGVAYSCVGYPPTPEGDLPGTPNKQCIPPDTKAPVPAGQIQGPYPLESDQGKVYVYMPYVNFAPNGSVSPHFGGLNRGTFTIAPNLDE